jgi:hypothetical protein
LGWDNKQRNILFIYSKEKHNNKIKSIFVKIYSLKKMLLYFELFNIPEIFINKIEIALEEFKNEIYFARTKIIDFLEAKINKETYSNSSSFIKHINNNNYNDFNKTDKTENGYLNAEPNDNDKEENNLEIYWNNSNSDIIEEDINNYNNKI